MTPRDLTVWVARGVELETLLVTHAVDVLAKEEHAGRHLGGAVDDLAGLARGSEIRKRRDEAITCLRNVIAMWVRYRQLTGALNEVAQFIRSLSKWASDYVLFDAVLWSMGPHFWRAP